MKIGFFGGCFNPPTNAHIDLAKKVLKECNLNKVIFVPVGDFYDKKELAKAEDRYNMLKIACEGIESIEVSNIEINIKKKIYAVDAFKLIEKKYLNEDIFFIMGADNFINITKWKTAEILVKNYKYIVLDRDDIDIYKYIDKDEGLKKHKEKIKIVTNENYKRHSSTEFRNIIKKENGYNQEIIPKKVLDYIIKNKIYKDAK